MATQTTNYKFTLPAGNDNYDVGDFNGNFIKIDAQMKANADAAETAGDTAANHTHGAITNNGKIGKAANKAVFTGEGGALKAGTLPIAAGGTGAVTADAARENLGAQKKRLTFANTNVAASAWAADETYADYPYRAAIPLTGVTAASFAEVVLSPTDAVSGAYAPVCETYAGGIYLYANAVPSADMTIPAIVIWG